MNERQFQSAIISTAEALGWRVWHVPAPMRPIGGNRFVPEPRGAGLPDLILIHEDPPRLIFAEVKGPDGVLSDAQREFLRLARNVAREQRTHIEGLVTTYGKNLVATNDMTITASGLVGVYVWSPGNEDMIEAILRGKVMVDG